MEILGYLKVRNHEGAAQVYFENREEEPVQSSTAAVVCLGDDGQLCLQEARCIVDCAKAADASLVVRARNGDPVVAPSGTFTITTDLDNYNVHANGAITEEVMRKACVAMLKACVEKSPDPDFAVKVLDAVARA